MKRYSSIDGKIFKLVDVWTVGPEDDLWVRYQNSQTQQEYTCREEAFLARFFPVLD